MNHCCGRNNQTWLLPDWYGLQNQCQAVGNIIKVRNRTSSVMIIPVIIKVISIVSCSHFEIPQSPVKLSGSGHVIIIIDPEIGIFFQRGFNIKSDSVFPFIILESIGKSIIRRKVWTEIFIKLRFQSYSEAFIQVIIHNLVNRKIHNTCFYLAI